MTPPRSTLLRNQLPGILLVVLASVARIWPLGQLGAASPWLTYFPAVAGAAMIGGIGAGLLATGLACLVVTTLWSQLAGQPRPLAPAESIGLLVFIFTGFLVSALAERMHRANAAARASRLRAEAAATEATRREHFIQTVTDSMPGMVGYWDRDLMCRFANTAYREWFARTSGEMIGAITLPELLGPELFELNAPYVFKALAGVAQTFERRLSKIGATDGWARAHYVPDRGPDGAIKGFFVLVTDVTAEKKVEIDLKWADSVFRNTTEGIFVTDAAGTILSVNPAFTDITGYSAQEAIGQTPRLLKSNRHDAQFHAEVWRQITTHGEWKGELWNRRKSGDVFLEWQTITRICGEAGIAEGYVSLFHDVTDARSNDERFRHLAFHDALTGLPNRALLMERVTRQIAVAQREAGRLALIYIDLDGFKAVNDALGHEVGDELLRVIAQRLQTLVRPGDTVARLGGDEFVTLVEDPNTVDTAAIASRIIATIREPFDLLGHRAQIGASIGVAIFPYDGVSAAELLRRADQAMYAAKAAGKNCWQFFDAVRMGTDRSGA
jgi:diguanylate cyclase (GGDEF)-like protein/PAS domain S-box-containing protein